MKWKEKLLIWLFIAGLLLCCAYFAHADGGYISILQENYLKLQTDFEMLQLQYNDLLSSIMNLLKYPGLIESLIKQSEENLNNQEKSLNIIEKETETLEASTTKEEKLLKESSTLLPSLEEDLICSIKIIKHLEKFQILKEIGIGVGCFIIGVGTGILLFKLL